MRHVNQIKKIIEQGDREKAYMALDNLLSLGPNNLEALKLKALLYKSEGKFEEEFQTWKMIIDLYPDDQDAVNYLLWLQMEEREKYYFTDDLKNGQRKYLAYPSELINISILGLLGISIFLISTQLIHKIPIINNDIVIISGFILLVLTPWIGIIKSYFWGLNYISVGVGGIEIASRIKKKFIGWDKFSTVCLVNNSDPYVKGLELVLIPEDSKESIIKIDLSQSSSDIKAKSHFVKDIKKYCEKAEYCFPKDISFIDGKKTCYF